MRERIACHPRILAVALELINDFPLAGNLVLAIGHMPLSLGQIFSHEPPVHAGTILHLGTAAHGVERSASSSRAAGTRYGPWRASAISKSGRPHVRHATEEVQPLFAPAKLAQGKSGALGFTASVGLNPNNFVNQST
jgi:hypothetical protein